MSVAGQVARRVGEEPRPPCSDAERRAAVRLRQWLRARGDDARLEPVWVRPQGVGATGLAAALGVAGSLASLASPLAGIACAAVAAVALALEAAGHASPMRRLFPARATQDVVVAPEVDGVALLVCARYDSPRAGLVSGPAINRLAARARRRWLPGARTWLTLAALAVAAAAAARAGGTGGSWLGVAQLVPSLVLLAGTGAALDAALAGWSDGERSAAAVAVAVAVHDELVQQPAGALAPGLVIYGAGAGGPQALRARLRQLAPDATRAVVIEVLPLGDGPACSRTGHPDLRAAATRAAAARANAANAPLLPRAPRLGRLAVVRIGAGDAGVASERRLEDAVDLALGIADALAATLRERHRSAGTPA